MESKFVSYCRVSTRQQGESGLGLDAQSEAIQRHLQGAGGVLIAEYVEVESGKRNDRPELMKALAHCEITKATLIVAKLDRLSRDSHFITGLQAAKIPFIVCDFPFANEFTITVFAALAQYERELISARTKEALARSVKPKGVMGKTNLCPHSEAGRILGRQKRKIKADEFAEKIRPVIEQYYNAEGGNLCKTATALTLNHYLTAKGNPWTAQGVKNVLLRGQQQ